MESQNSSSSATAANYEVLSLSHPNEEGYHDMLASRDSLTGSLYPLLSGIPDTVSDPGDKKKQGRRSQDTLLAKIGISDPTVDPSNPSFNFERWSHTIVDLRNQLGIPKPPRSGFAFRRLTVRGSGPAIEQQDTVWTWLTSPFDLPRWHVPKQSKTILHGLDGVLQRGEMLLVLGRPGSGCTTFLKSVTGETRNLELDAGSVLHYTGISHRIMAKHFKGELIYNQEVDEHLPYLTVGQTLEFAAAMRTPRTRLPLVTRTDRIKHVVEVVLTVFGLSHTRDTIVGSDDVRGISGGERKRLSIAETALSEAAISAWDNSTRGLDAESALRFVSRLRTLSDLTKSANAVAIYQSSEAIIDLFDKILVLYEGHQIFFGRAASASEYFERMGWHRPPRQVTGDFLTAVTNPAQREAREGFERLVPRTPEEFEKYWHESPEYASLQADIDQYHQDFSLEGGETVQRDFELARSKIKAKWMLSSAIQTVSFPMQTMFCIRRAYQQLWNDKASTLSMLFGEIIIAIVVGSIFYSTPHDSNALFSYGSLLFFAVILNVLMSITDMHSLYKGRSVVRKQVSYAFYRPSADALASVLADIPVKLGVAICFNIVLYFLSGLGRTVSQFFTFFLCVFLATLAMSMVFRTIAAGTQTLPQAMAISGFLVLALVTYTGFVLPGPYMHPLLKWISSVNPLSYAFEALLVNQAHATNYTCAGVVPPYEGLTGDTFVCPIPGAAAGETYVSGDAWLEASYGYNYSHLQRNLRIMLAFFFFFLFTYLLATELAVDFSSGPDVLVFLRGRVPGNLEDTNLKLKGRADAEQQLATSGSALDSGMSQVVQVCTHRDTFSWSKVSLDVMIKGRSRRLIDNVSGWVRPGTLTALMGVSGAGKTTLLNTIAQRVPSGVIQGDFYADGKPLPISFKSDVGYVQQQDIHLETSTVREALQLSAMLRQPFNVPESEKLAYVEDIIQILGMNDFADALVGVPGKGLNVEQRKRVSIGVELAAKPAMVLFLDEPTSGLDSQSSEAILLLLRKLAAGGLGILCTIHQPSAMLFQQFDRLLLMARGGRVAYFGDIGDNSETVLQYFGDRGPRRCADAENPAEYLLDVVGNPDVKTHDWPGLWDASAEAHQVSTELERLRNTSPARRREQSSNGVQIKDRGAYSVPLLSQIPIVCLRVFQQHWRSPTYIVSKFMLGIASSSFIGFSFFRPGRSIHGTQNAIFSIMMICATFSSLVQQIMPKFVMQRTLYEVRERHSQTYSWAVFLLANILVEIPYHVILGVVTFVIFNYTVFDIRSTEDQGLVLLFFVYFYVLAGTFAHMVVAALPDAITAGRVTTILFSMMILFAGIFQTPAALPRFWVFMYRVSPMTYLLAGVAVSGLSGNPITCSPPELAIFQPPTDKTCGAYLWQYLKDGALGTLLDPDATVNCSYCPLRFADQVLARSGMYYDQRWMDWGVSFAYICFNIAAVFGLYYFFRVRAWGRQMK